MANEERVVDVIHYGADWVKVQCSKCGGQARIEEGKMDPVFKLVRLSCENCGELDTRKLNYGAINSPFVPK